jgi:hypothetical protein
MIKLVLERPTAGGFCKMVRFIDNHRVGVVLDQSFFHGLSQVAHADG